MSNSRKQRLIDLGAEALADALLELVTLDDAADDLVERMLATPKENIQRFREKLSGLKRIRRFVHWRESAGFASELETLLQDLKAGVDDPRVGVKLAGAFYETDNEILANCDDSSGLIGNVYRYNAKELFVGYASRCSDKNWLANLVLKLNLEDEYGVRDTLVDCAAEYLPEPNIRNMIIRLQGFTGKENDEYRKRHWLRLVESLARQIKDAPLFEKTRITSWGEPSTAARVDIAQVYLESGDARTALSWLEQIPKDETYQVYERDQLLLDVFEQLGETAKQAAVAWRIFRRHRCADSLQRLLALIGDDQRETVIAGEAASILDEKALSLSDAAFLIELGRMNEAETYLLDRAGQLDGDFYGTLLSFAQAMEAEGRHLAAAAVYRALLDSILRRGRTKTYAHGVRYLKKLDRLASSISDWRGLDDHNRYTQLLRQTHGRKSSFWSRYEK